MKINKLCMHLENKLETLTNVLRTKACL